MATLDSIELSDVKIETSLFIQRVEVIHLFY